MPKTQPLSVDLLRIDAGTQSRISITEEAVEDYAEVIQEAEGEWPFGPIDVFHDGNEYLVADGFHRTLAAQRAKRASVPCRVHKGTATDARIFSMTANDKHGLRMTRADKLACVQWLLNEGGKMTQAAIAEKAGVSRRFVQKIVAERKPSAMEKAHRAPFSGQQSSQQTSTASTASPPPPPSADLGDPFDEANWASTEEYAPPLAGGGEEWGSEPAPGGSESAGAPGKRGSESAPKPPPVVAKTGREAKVWEAQQVLKQWSDTVGRWMNGNPCGIDVYRELFPGPLGDRTIDAARELFNAMLAWKKGLK